MKGSTPKGFALRLRGPALDSYVQSCSLPELTEGRKLATWNAELVLIRNAQSAQETSNETQPKMTLLLKNGVKGR
jgi:hypothetical protein